MDVVIPSGMGFLDELADAVGDLLGGCLESILAWIIGAAVLIGICVCCLWGLSSALSGH